MIGVPQVIPSFIPDINEGISASFLLDVRLVFPGDLLPRNLISSAISIDIPAGIPSIVTPIAEECDSPNIEMIIFFPIIDDIFTSTLYWCLSLAFLIQI